MNTTLTPAQAAHTHNRVMMQDSTISSIENYLYNMRAHLPISNEHHRRLVSIFNDLHQLRKDITK